jgi:hypothetical protein
MYAVTNHLHLTIPVDQLQPGLQQEAISLLEHQPGFRALYFVKNTDDQATVILLWETAEDADNGAKTFGPTWFAENVAPYLASAQQRSGGEVIVQYQK